MSRPPESRFSLKALVTFPYRLCNPPPAAGNVRSCKVTPLLHVSLDDVLNKRHLPPLTLKDFEEWLLYVEGQPQYLYFELWFREYELRYSIWLARSGYKSAKTSKHELDYVDLVPPSASLALFFTRAKQTFFEKMSPHYIGEQVWTVRRSEASSSALSSVDPDQRTLRSRRDARSPEGPWTLPEDLATHPHPHPSLLGPARQHVQSILKDSIANFAQTACTNVGSRRAWCGIAGGTAISLGLGLVPALIALLFAPQRWWRLVGFVGLFIGLTIVTSASHGICMMVYVFGDFRQLKSFELARPNISRPSPVARARPRLKDLVSGPESESEHDQSAMESQSNDVQSDVKHQHPLPSPDIPPSSFPLSPLSPPTTAAVHDHDRQQPRHPPGLSVSLPVSGGDHGITVSPAFYYPKRGVGEAPADSEECDSPSSPNSGSRSRADEAKDIEKGDKSTMTDHLASDEDVRPTAGFIAPAHQCCTSETPFDFDLLPGAAPTCSACIPHSPEEPSSPGMYTLGNSGLASPSSNSERTEGEKDPSWWMRSPPSLAVPPVHASSCPRHPALARLAAASFPPPNPQPGRPSWRRRLKKVMAIPAFGPMTTVTEPLVQRGHWEIVVRSAAVALLGTVIVEALLIALPERR